MIPKTGLTIRKNRHCEEGKMKRSIAIAMAAVLIAVMFMGIRCETEAAVGDRQACEQVFDAAYYAQNNPDVVAAVGNSTAALLEHYMNYGLAEGRNASAAFNAHAYRSRYADLNAAFGDSWIEYVKHYVSVGKSEGRDASPSGSLVKSQTAQSTAAQTADTGSKQTSANGGYTLLGSYSTIYNAKIPRATNVELAAGRINGVVVQPGQGFSFSNTILPRTEENGYVVAPVFINKQISSGIGGGICQVSSTLYACMKTVGLPATERHAHSLPVTYIPEGYDATISGTTLDLRFTNIYSTPIKITASADKGTLTVSLWRK